MPTYFSAFLVELVVWSGGSSDTSPLSTVESVSTIEADWSYTVANLVHIFVGWLCSMIPVC